MSTLPQTPPLSTPTPHNRSRRIDTPCALCSSTGSRSSSDGLHDPDSWLELALAAGDTPPSQPLTSVLRQRVLAAMRSLGKDAPPLTPACPALHVQLDLFLPGCLAQPTLLHIEAKLTPVGDDYCLSTADEALFDTLNEAQADGSNVLACRLQRSQPRPVSVRVILLDADASQAAL